jgi:hypothetical protein
MKSKIPWKLKMDRPQTPEIKPGPDTWNERYGGHRMVIPTPRIIEKLLFEIKKGKVWTLSQLREHIAEECKADYACPMTTGIFLRICAEYAEEIRNEGAKKIPPYWRVVRDDGSLNEKLPGGIEQQMKYLTAEGITFQILPKKKPRVVLS